MNYLQWCRVRFTVAQYLGPVVTRILAVGDDSESARLLEQQFAKGGVELSIATHGSEGVRLAREWSPHVILLELVLPDMEGNDVCRTLKRQDATREIPIIVLTERNDEVDRVVAFELGAEDYVTKPFSPRELALRVRTVMQAHARRTTGSVAAQFGRVRLDREAHRAWVDGNELTLSLLEYKILSALCSQGHRVQSRKDLLDEVWGGDTTISARTVDAHVKRLRKKLGSARGCIETVRGVGYRLTKLRGAH